MYRFVMAVVVFLSLSLKPEMAHSSHQQSFEGLHADIKLNLVQNYLDEPALKALKHTSRNFAELVRKSKKLQIDNGILILNNQNMSSEDVRMLMLILKSDMIHTVSIGLGPQTTGDCVVALADKCTNLRNLRIRLNQGSISSTHLVYLAERCKGLISISCPIQDRNEAKYITDTTLKALAKSCPEFAELDTGWYSTFSKSSLLELASACPISMINLSYNQNINDEVLTQFITKRPKITTLLLRGTDVTNKGLFEVGNHCKNLKVLDASYCATPTGLTDQAIVHIIQNCPLLEELDVMGKRSIALTDAAIEALIDKSQNLRRLNIESCPRITAEAILKFISKRPTLEYLNLKGTNMNKELFSEKIGVNKKLRIDI